MGQCIGRGGGGVILLQNTSKVKPNGTAPLQQDNAVVESLPQSLKLSDRFDNPILFCHAGDIFLAPSPIIPDGRQQLAEVKQMELRADDVIIAGFMRTGNHWVQQIVRMLLQDSTEYKPNTFNCEVFEYIPPHMWPPPTQARTFFTHLRFHHLPIQVTQKKVKIIHLLRNPKDIFASMYSYVNGMTNVMSYKGTWDQFFILMLEMGLWHGDWFDYVLDWESEIASHPEVPVFVLAYEDLLRDPVGHVEKLNAFLGLNRSQTLCSSIVDICQLDNMRRLEADMSKQLGIYKKGSPGVCRKGQIGDWKNWFTPWQNRVFDQVYQKRMVGSQRTFTFE